MTTIATAAASREWTVTVETDGTDFVTRIRMVAGKNRRDNVVAEFFSHDEPTARLRANRAWKNLRAGSQPQHGDKIIFTHNLEPVVYPTSEQCSADEWHTVRVRNGRGYATIASTRDECTRCGTGRMWR